MRLASQSDAVAAALRSGESCLARSRARALRSQVAAAIAAGSIPASLAAGVRGASARLVSRISCTPPAPPPAALTCAGIDERRRTLEAEKHALGEHGKGKSGQAGNKEIEQEEHALDRQRKGCE
jgi:hypothetical protein